MELHLQMKEKKAEMEGSERESNDGGDRPHPWQSYHTVYTIAKAGSLYYHFSLCFVFVFVISGGILILILKEWKGLTRRKCKEQCMK